MMPKIATGFSPKAGLLFEASKSTGDENRQLAMDFTGADCLPAAGNRTETAAEAAVSSAGNHGGFRWRLVQDPTERWGMQYCNRWKIPPCWL